MPVVPPFVPAAVVFDLDGVLVDSEGLWAEVEREVVAGFGFEWTEDVQAVMHGKGPVDSAIALAAHLGLPDPVDVQRRVGEAALQVFRGRVKPRDGAAALVEGLAGRVPLAVATNSSRPLAELSLASAGFQGLLLVTVDDVTAPKPDPAPYVTACRAVGADPARSIALEDSEVGVRSARDAGMWVIGCPSLPNADLAAAHVVADLRDVDARALLGATGG